MKRSIFAAALTLALGVSQAWAQPTDILNVSYDVSRELFEAVNAKFIPSYKASAGVDVTVNQSHAGSSKQAGLVLEGLAADVVTFNQVTDIETLAGKQFVATDWQSKYPNSASPFYSLPAFLVREGNPKGIVSWADLAKDGVGIVIPNPKTSGNGRYTYLAARAWAQEEFAGDEAKIEDYLKKVFANVKVFDTGGRQATTTFVENKIGDVLITFETEVLGTVKAVGDDQYDAVTPPVSLLAEFPVAVVDKVVDERGTRPIAEAYLNYLYTPEGQDIIGSFYNRVNDAAAVEKYKAQFPEVRLIKVEDAFGGWAKVKAEHFAEGGLLDKVLPNL
ncbi:thiosulfate ABC transporter substrate-binding protein CysP [Devosia sp. ZB163]|uniref:thiosulfate ABC transporter substrate-binding protein CysP n=1 Tax=Devosia sp. ZB163 TaxID=3025938 RepID=UPI00235EB37C|nr:thiosulfate ABC transporter substrate-binding protein CysP [Devosia sp. ZB163]MDC9824167.1 thiosulfate ABC transporter substrate-binding protein CysP [Devosia sp. ZB163]